MDDDTDYGEMRRNFVNIVRKRHIEWEAKVKIREVIKLVEIHRWLVEDMEFQQDVRDLAGVVARLYNRRELEE